jgi:succinate dehydrogenase / fumarate reductase cytochrome b subunit
VNKKRPVNLELTSLTYPPMAIASILHRISGIVLFLLLPLMLYLLNMSLHSAESFAQTQALINTLSYKLIIWSFCVALIYHLLAGIRHIVMDFGFGEQLSAGRYSATGVIILATILAIILGIWIW